MGPTKASWDQKNVLQQADNFSTSTGSSKRTRTNQSRTFQIKLSSPEPFLRFFSFQHQKWLTRWKNEDDVEDERSETRIKSFEETDHYRDAAAAIKIRFNFETFFWRRKRNWKSFFDMRHKNTRLDSLTNFSRRHHLSSSDTSRLDNSFQRKFKRGSWFFSYLYLNLICPF